MKNFLPILSIAVLAFCMAFSNPKKTVVIDVSHGGKDAGVTLNGTSEKEIALSIANKIKAMNTHTELEIILTRNTDSFLSLKDRAAFINQQNPELVISIHVNSSKNSEQQGSEIYILDDTSNELASKIKTALSNHSPEVKNSNMFLLKNVEAPMAVIEVGFLSNKADYEWLTSEAGQTEMAKAIYSSLQ